MPDSQEPKQGNNNDLRNAQFGGGFINAENVNAGRIGGDIWNIFLGQQTTLVGNPARPRNERILLAAVKEEVSARLRQSLHNAVLINLGKESQPQQVKRPWDAHIKIGLKPAEPIPDTTKILEVFDSQEIAGKLLILGEPGSGKTTTQLELAQALVSRAEEQPDYPVPVLFNLSSWKDDQQSITDWLVAELKSKYGVSKKLGQEWVENHQLLPLLDGLDELEPQRQELCVYAINQFLVSETRPLYLVVCSQK
jgi:predicted NACHT family NTPase